MLEYNISASGIMVLCKACDKYLVLLRNDGYPVQVHDHIMTKMVMMEEDVKEIEIYC